MKHEPKEIGNNFLSYYNELYRQLSNVSEIKLFFEGLDLPSIGKTQNYLMTADFTIEEINNAISRLKSSKVPGSDGFPPEWYKIFGAELSPLLLKTFNWIKENCMLPP